MRSAPAVRAVVNFGGVWRASVGVWSLASGCVGAWWLVGLRSSAQPALVATLLVAVMACVALAMSTARSAPHWLHWDGLTWRLQGAVADAVCEGRVSAAIDLGGWMLLRFDKDHEAFVPRRERFLTPTRWLPVQRRGSEREWHALRCAVHAPQALGSTR